ncbi:MAG TPA: alcohol dehydrogenase [Acidimicrobiaceae bacterium]|nr:alcohol dehydrogenase [Acidimicrobiaceae bacterium]
MKAAVLNQIPGDLEIEDISVDKPGPNEVLVQVVNAGLCHSDLHFMDAHWKHPLPAVMGHESAGVVQAVGRDVSYVSPGDNVITCLSIFCGSCANCLTGRPNICSNLAAVARRPDEKPRLSKPDGQPVDQFARLGGFAEEMLVHQNGVVAIRPEMPLDRAALIGCGVTTGLGAVFKTARIEPGSTVAVFGAGGIGLSAVQGARIAGAGRIISVDVTDEKLEVARRLGATDTVNGDEVDAVAAIKEMTGGGVDYAFECIGLKSTCEQAWAASKLGGTTVIVGMMPYGEKIEIPGYEVFMMEKRLQGSMMGSNSFRVDMPRFVDMYLDGRLMLDEMISAHITLEQINDGYEQMRRRVGTRTVVDFA